MTSAARPTFDPAQGKEIQRGPAFHSRLQPAHTKLKVRQPGQGGAAGFSEQRDLRSELLAAEAASEARRQGKSTTTQSLAGSKRAIQARPASPVEESSEAEEAKRRKILEDTRDIDADDSDSDSSSEDESDEEDETAELMRELEKIKRERAETKAKEDAEKAAKEEEAREADIAYGNPLLNAKAFNVGRRWDDDVVFKNQARGTEQKTKKEFVNDLLRSDFHKKFMSKYIR
ncbi:hypothetical protein BT93_L0841 [Corymbia citriodora subsp. variegata]|uniref:Cwf15/Cwc15 cell cycle control protein n=1 Tax=Corymbia citriodora subsp. variegata TaxID=360336 RepID=A0A8T0CFF8_CORYI|nr:hypothetical protein BT93_L0841 [Corymbia citriodora subsp. variegata]